MNNAFCRNNLTLKYFDSKIKLCVMKAMEKKTLQRQIYSIRDVVKDRLDKLLLPAPFSLW